jgi:hypothetical protein
MYPDRTTHGHGFRHCRYCYRRIEGSERYCTDRRCRDYFEAEGPRCTYCNDRAADQMDHVVPRAERKHNPHYSRSLPNVVPACGDCNRIKGGRVFESIDEVRDYIAWRLRRRHEKLLSRPAWAPDEVDEYFAESPGSRLRHDIDNERWKRVYLEHRLQFLDGELGARPAA